MSPRISRRTYIQTCLLGAASLALPLGDAHAGTPIEHASEHDVIRRIRFRLTLQNPFARTLFDQKLWCYMPLQSETQIVQYVHVSMPQEIMVDRLGHQLLKLSFDEVPGYFQKIITVEVCVQFKPDPPELSLQENSQWLMSERFIEANSFQVIALAAQLRQASDSQTVEAVYKWVSENIEYAGFIAEDLGALYALENKRGDCTEFAYLVAALARANRIPARVIGGYFAVHDIAPKPQDYHNWAEVLVDGRWNLVDAQKGYLNSSPGRYVAFHIHHQTPVNALGTAHRYWVDGQLQVSF